MVGAKPPRSADVRVYRRGRPARNQQPSGAQGRGRHALRGGRRDAAHVPAGGYLPNRRRRIRCALWADHTGEQGAEAAARIKALLRESNYEISVGVHQIEPDENLEDGVDRAENAMRRDKEAYYRETGNLDQMRALNEKLERILVEKRDMDMFLRAIAPRYIGVYAVDNDTGRMRSIVIPDRFRRIVKEAKGLFSPALAQYAEEVVADAWRGSFDPFLDLPGVIRRVEREGMVCVTFRRRDGAWIRLQVMRYLPDEDEGGGTLWIFSAADADEQRA